MHQVYDRGEVHGVQTLDDPVGPGPVPFVKAGVYAIPGDAVPDHGGSAGGCEVEVLAPVVIVAGQLVLIKGPEAGRDLRDEGVLDPDGELQAVRPLPEAVHYGRYTRK